MSRRQASGAFAFFVVLILGSMVGQADAQELEPEGQGPRWNSEACLDCHDGSEDVVTFPSGEQLSVAVDGTAFLQAPHYATGVQCAHCHTNIARAPHDPVSAGSTEEYVSALVNTCSRCHWRQYTIELDAAHSLLDLDQRADAPGCPDCHPPHEVEALALASPEMQATCGGCHAEAVGEELEAIHTLNPVEREKANAPSLVWFYVLIVAAVLALVLVVWGLMVLIERLRGRRPVAAG